MSVFFTIFEKVKKDIFARNFFKMGSMDLKMCAKKTCNRSGSSPKILSKSDHSSKIYNVFKQGHFLFDPTVCIIGFFQIEELDFAVSFLCFTFKIFS